MKLNSTLSLVIFSIFLTILTAAPKTQAGTPIRWKPNCSGTYNNPTSNDESEQEANPDEVSSDDLRENSPNVDDEGSEFPERDNSENCDTSYGAGGPFSDQF